MSAALPWMIAAILLGAASAWRPLGRRPAGRIVAAGAYVIFAIGAWKFAATYVL